MTDTSCVFRPSKVDKIKQLTEELQQEENQLQLFFQLSPDLFCILTPDLRFVKLNQAWEFQLGWNQVDCLNKRITDFVHPCDVDVTIRIMSELSEGKITRFVNRFRKRDGSSSENYVAYEWNITTGSDKLVYAAARICQPLVMPD